MNDSHSTLIQCIKELKDEVDLLRQAISNDTDSKNEIEKQIQKLNQQVNVIKKRIENNTGKLATTRRMLTEASQGYEQIIASTSTLIQIIKQSSNKSDKN